MTIRFEIAGSPVAKGRGRAVAIGGKARIYTPAKTRQWESWARHAAQEAMGGRAPLEVPVQVEIVAWHAISSSWPKWKQNYARTHDMLPTGKPDIDQIVKAVLDACNTVVFRDDSYVVLLIASQHYAERPHVAVAVTPLLARPMQITRKADLHAQPMLAPAYEGAG